MSFAASAALEDDAKLECALVVEILERIVLGDIEQSRIAHAAATLEVACEIALRDHRRGSNELYTRQRVLHWARRSRGPRNVTGAEGQQRLDLFGDVVSACQLGEIPEPCEGGDAPPFCLSLQIFGVGGAECVWEPVVGVAPVALGRRALGGSDEDGCLHPHGQSPHGLRRHVPVEGHRADAK